MNNKGLTLIEIILAIVLLSIIALTFISALSAHFVMLSNTKTITEDVFTAQKSVERQIEDIKTKIYEGKPVANGKDYELFGRDITGYPVRVNINSNKVINTVVGETRTPQFTVPEASDVQLDLYLNTSRQADNDDYSKRPGLNIRASSNVDGNGVFLLNKHEWYVSRPGFYIPIVGVDNIDRDFDLGRLYPLFPNDYIPIPIKSESNMQSSSILSVIEDDYAGRHIIYTITPFAESGRKGDTIISEPVYLRGLPNISNLILHLDASLISKEDTDSINTVGENLYVRRWMNAATNNNHAQQADANLQPELMEVQYQDDVYVWGKSTLKKESATSALMNIPSFNYGGGNLNSFTFLMVLKGNTVQPGGTNILLGKNSFNNRVWSFGWQADGSLGFGKSNMATLLSNQGIDDSWHVFTGIATNNRVDIRLDGVPGTSRNSSGNYNINNLDINWNDLEIAELVMYSGTKTVDELYEIEQYLINKYNPDPSIAEMKILSLRPLISGTVYKGQTFTLPGMLPANMSNGTIQDVAVTWSNSIDTSTLGMKSSTATAVLDSSKSVTLNVDVIAIDHLKAPAPITVEYGVYYPLPTTLTAVLTNGEERQVDVTWSHSTENLSIGSHTITATAVLDSDKTVGLTVDVVPVSVTGVELNPSNIMINVGKQEILYANVLPVNADNKTLIWSSSNTNVATVSSDGTVTGVAAGTAEITVTTQDGGFMATSVVTVVNSPTSIALNKSNVQLRINQSDQLSVILTPHDAYYESITWSTSNSGIVQVDNNGRITAKAAGTANVTATVHTPLGTLTASCVVEVTKVTATGYRADKIQVSGIIVRTTRADIYIILSDGTEHFHGRESATGFLFDPTINKNISGSIVLNTGETVTYSMRIYVPPD